MAAHVRERSAPGLRIVVRNAAYERIQVRCTLRLARGSHPGAAMVRINRAIVEFLSPWHAGGHRAEFDWDIRSEAVEACLRELDEVEAAWIELGRAETLSRHTHPSRRREAAAQ